MVSLRRATTDDISFIMATERLPGYDVLVGCFEEDVHRANLAHDNWLYLIGLDASGARQGFAVPWYLARGRGRIDARVKHGQARAPF